MNAAPVRRAWSADAALLVVRLGLAAVFVGAAIPKIAAPDLFAGAIFNYQMLPAWGVNAVALVLPWLELFVGLGLALGIWSRASALLVAGMMLVFIAAFSTAKARGLDIACGCFEMGKGENPTSIAWVVVRDLGLCAAALVVARFADSPGLLGLVRRFGGRGSAPAIS
jgi:uncharacterized membrane protein YphA (DoxX/SURF4 family)